MRFIPSLCAVLCCARCCRRSVAGYLYDTTATAPRSEAGQASNDLHCDPAQTFYVPAGGALLTSFSTAYDPPTVSPATGAVARMALYGIVNGSYQLVAGTNAQSDIPLTAGTVGGPVQVLACTAPHCTPLTALHCTAQS